jgi:hypothetical protein
VTVSGSMEHLEQSQHDTTAPEIEILAHLWGEKTNIGTSVKKVLKWAIKSSKVSIWCNQMDQIVFASCIYN